MMIQIKINPIYRMKDTCSTIRAEFKPTQLNSTRAHVPDQEGHRQSEWTK